MTSNKLESAEQIIPHLFNIHKRRRKNTFPLEIQQHYWQHFLEEHWEDICGANLKKFCQIQKLEGDTLTINTVSSIMANELFMVKNQLIKKINFVLQGMWTIKNLNFYVGGCVAEKKQNKGILPQASSSEKDFGTCSLCGAKLRFAGKICCYCSRKIKEQEKAKIKELLLCEPWLDYTNCTNYIKCDKILFTAIKDELKNYYFEKVRNDIADTHEKLIAVMLLTGKAAAELDENTFNNAVAFLRRKNNVSTRRVGLHGKK